MGVAKKLPLGRYVNSREYECKCPGCSKIKFYLNVESGKGHCKACGTVAHTWKDFYKVFEGQSLTLINIDYTSESETEEVPPDLVSCLLSDGACAYLRSRKVKPEFAHEIGIKWSALSDSLYIPLTPCSAEFPVSYQKRKLERGAKWRNLAGHKLANYLFGVSHPGGPIVLVEGAMDILSPGLWGYAHCLLGSKISQAQLAYLAKHYTSVVLWLDPDYAGAYGDMTISSKLKAWGLPVESIRTKYDPGTYGSTHPLPTKLRSILDRKRLVA